MDRRSGYDRGASIIEILTAIVLLSILLAMSVPSLRAALARSESSGWARAITRELSAARQAAMTSRQSVYVTIAPSEFVIGRLGGEVLRRDTLPSHLTLATTCPANTCTFGPRGIPLTSGTITLTSTSSVTYTLTIEAGTGRAYSSGP